MADLMQPLFVSFRAHKDGKAVNGHIVLPDFQKIAGPKDIDKLIAEVGRNYDKGTVIIIGFRRLEA